MKMKDSFTVRLAVDLGFKAAATALPGLAWLFIGPVGTILAHFAREGLGFLADKGILAIDLTIDSIQIGMQTREYRIDALAAYKKARARVYTEEEKRAIRQQYLEVIRKFARVGNGRQP